MSLRAIAVTVAATLCVVAVWGQSGSQQAAKYRLKPGATGKVCLSCHVDFQETVAKPHVHTPVKSGDCAACHDPHASDHGKLLETDPNRICATCHADIVPQTALSVHETAVEGRCVACHDPHASSFPNNLRASGNAVCLECHTDLASAIAGASHKHAPVERDCLGCHTPHASTAGKSLLVKPVPALCVKCHSPSSQNFTRNHMGYPVGESDCTSCHDPHGSSNPGILWASVHQPVGRKLCAQCHADASGATPLATKRAGADLCRGCHNDLFNEIAGKRHEHGPLLDQKGCANCHNPHAAKQAPLLLAEQGTLCGSCHADAIRRQERSLTKHPPIEAGECSICHTPHASDESFLLAGAENDVCGTCHDWKQHSAHPMGEKAVDQRNANLTVGCESCHRSHGTPFEKFTHRDGKQELCMQCHFEFSR